MICFWREEACFSGAHYCRLSRPFFHLVTHSTDSEMWFLTRMMFVLMAWIMPEVTLDVSALGSSLTRGAMQTKSGEFSAAHATMLSMRDLLVVGTAMKLDSAGPNNSHSLSK